MRKYAIYIFTCVIVSFFIAGCSNKWASMIPKSSFDAAFPKRNKDLTQVLGSKLYIKRGKDTTVFSVGYNGKLNLITDKNGDTIFCGQVSKFRGLYYFSQSLSDTSYLIYAVKKSGDLLYGLNAPWYEGILIDHRIEKGEYKDMVKSISPDGKVIRLHPVKKEMKKLYADIMDSLPPDTLLGAPANIKTPAEIDTAAITQQVDSEEFNMLSKIYPNPAKDEMNVDLQDKEDVKYVVSDITGKTMSEGQFNDINNKIDVSSLPNGIYVLTLTNADGKEQESVKFVKKD